MADKLKTLAFDGWSGFTDLAKAEQQPDINEDSASQKTRGNWGFDWNRLAGRAQHMLRLLEAIRQRHQVQIVQTAHLAAEKLYFERLDRSGERVQESRQVAWKVDLPGQMQEQILRPFDEVWHLQIAPNAMGKPPVRRLFTEPHLWSGGAGASAGMEGFPFEAKTREGIRGPIEGPTFDKIAKALPEGGVMPDRILVVGIAGAGKTTMLSTWPRPLGIVDMWGGAERVARGQADIEVRIPDRIEDVYRILIHVRDKGVMP